MAATFEDLGLSRELLKSIEDLGFEEPSPIQLLAIPTLLAGRDVVGQAQTGTGKTAAFGLPILEKIVIGKGQVAVQALVLCPTRELAIQVAENLGKLAGHKRGIAILPVYGGQPIDRQFRALAKGVHVVVGTPGRLIDHLQRGTLKLNEVKMVVLDEADEMLDMGFREDIELILSKAPDNCQRVMFSATMPPLIRELAKRFLNEPEILSITQKMLTVPAIEQVYFEVRAHQKMDALCRILDSQGFRKALVFCLTKRSVDEVTMHLQQRGYQSDGLHGNLNQTQRDRVMSRFRSDGIEILVATDVASRGIDVDDVDAVINYDIPHDVEGYVHRIGRTGRAGRTGKAFTFVTVREHYKLRDIIRYTKAHIIQGQLPTLRDVNHIRTSKLLDEVRQTLAAGPLDRWLQLVEDFLTEQFPDGEITNRDISAALLKLLMQRDFGNQDKAFERDELTEAPRGPRGNDYGSESRADGRPRSQNWQDRNDRGERGERPGKFERPERPGRSDRPERAERPDRSTPMTKVQVNVGHMHHVTPGALVGAITGESGIQGRSLGAINIQNRFSVVEVASDLVDDVLTALDRGLFICGIKVTLKKDDGVEAPVRKTFSPGTHQYHPNKFGKKPRGATSGKKSYKEPNQ